MRAEAGLHVLRPICSAEDGALDQAAAHCPSWRNAAAAKRADRLRLTGTGRWGGTRSAGWWWWILRARGAGLPDRLAPSPGAAGADRVDLSARGTAGRPVRERARPAVGRSACSCGGPRDSSASTTSATNRAHHRQSRELGAGTSTGTSTGLAGLGGLGLGRRCANLIRLSLQLDLRTRTYSYCVIRTMSYY